MYECLYVFVRVCFYIFISTIAGKLALLLSYAAVTRTSNKHGLNRFNGVKKKIEWTQDKTATKAEKVVKRAGSKTGEQRTGR